MDKFRKALDERTRSMLPEQLTLVTVKEVDEQKLTCTCTIITEDIDIYDVSLTPVIDTEASQITTIPTIGTKALMAIVGNDIRNCYLVSSQAAKQVIIRGGDLGGMVKVKELKKELEKTHNLLAALLQVINGAPIPEPGTGSPSAFQTVLKTAIASFSLGQFDDIENEKVTHG